MDQAALEAQLDDFDLDIRKTALAELSAAVATGAIVLPPTRNWLNLHCHSFYSYNGYGMSPSRIVWMAKTLGLEHVGLVDFDVLDGVDEFHAAGRLLAIKTHAGIETRAYVEAFADRQINSPGEPGVAYHMGTGFLSGAVPAEQHPFLDGLRERARARNLIQLAAVNAYLAPVELDYDADVLPLTPKGVATERHICAAYQAKAEEVFEDPTARIAFWNEKLGGDTAAIIDDQTKLQGLIRAKTMKAGGVGYQQPDEHSFPRFEHMNAFTAACGALPTMAWLNGESAGEDAVEELLDLHLAKGLMSVAIVPDRNWNFPDAEVRKAKVAQLERFVTACLARDLFIQVGTELNAPGLKLVDDFDAPELAPFVDIFRRGANIAFGHAVAMATDGKGYTSAWAEQNLPDRKARNDHFEKLGRETAVLP